MPGIQICEHLPRMATQMDKLCLLRSMEHRMPVHGPACSEMYSGRPYFGPPVTDQARSEDWPSLAALTMRFASAVLLCRRRSCCRGTRSSADKTNA